MNINHKNVVYIGGCGGIGSETCKLLVKNKVANLAILDLMENEKVIKEISKINPSSNVFFRKIDIRSKKIIEECLDEVILKMGNIDLLINGSGVFNEIDAELTIGVNLLGLIHSSTVALNKMDKSKGSVGGIIVNISSTLGLDTNPLVPVYSASKAGVVSFTRSLAQMFNKTGVSFITICPGPTNTPLLCKDFVSESSSLFSEEIEMNLKACKMQSPYECAKCIIEAIELNKNGTVYMIDGGEMNEITFPRFWIPEKVNA